MNKYEEIGRKIQSLANEVQSTKDILDMIESEAKDRIAELESIKQDAEEVEGELQDYLNNFDGLQATLERADRIRDDAEGQNITI